jgi:hypothetical protein
MRGLQLAEIATIRLKMLQIMREFDTCMERITELLKDGGK